LSYHIKNDATTIKRSYKETLMQHPKEGDGGTTQEVKHLIWKSVYD